MFLDRYVWRIFIKTSDFNKVVISERKISALFFKLFVGHTNHCDYFFNKFNNFLNLSKRINTDLLFIGRITTFH